jgi:hypothetical protein
MGHNSSTGRPSARARASAVESRGTAYPSSSRSTASRERPVNAAISVWRKPAASRARRSGLGICGVILPLLGMARSSPSERPSWPTLDDAERTRITRSKRDSRRQEQTHGGVQITGRDEALSWLRSFAANELLAQPEVRTRLEQAVAHRRTLSSANEFLDYWIALERLDTDYDGVLGGAGELDPHPRRLDSD